MKSKLLVLSVLLCLMATDQKIEADEYISNLGNLWTSGGIGDIHGLFPGGTPYGNDTVVFTTGAGNFSLNSFTLEFEHDSGYPAGLAAPQWLTIQIFQGGSLLGDFGNPVIDPRPTQWPRSSNPNAYTEFIGFSPLQPITLNPFTEYSIVASMPANSPVSAALLFTRSSEYRASGGWLIGATTTGNPFASGERLVIAVDASLVPEPNTVVSLLVGFIVLIGGRRKRLANRMQRTPRLRPCSNPGVTGAGSLIRDVGRFEHAGTRCNLGKMDADNMKRGYFLPDGCKDLIDVIAPKVTVMDRRLMITAQLPELGSEDIEVTWEARQVRISRKQSSDHAAFESVTDVPPDYDISRAQAVYHSGHLRIVIPRS